jgi:hypothetical protein
MDYMFGNDEIKLHVFEIKDTPESEKLLAVWVTVPDIDENKVEKSEKYIQRIDVSEDVSNLLSELFGAGTGKKSLAEEIVKQVETLCSEYNLQSIQLSPETNADCLCFSGGWGNQCFIVGEALADKLNIDDVKIDSRSMMLSFTYNGIKIIFKNK